MPFLSIRNYFLKIILIPLLLISVHAQDKYFFEKLSVSDGLSNSVVLCTYQDHLGYLWIGTIDGLDRYDGYNIKVYKNIQGDSTSLPYNYITSIGEDSKGNLFVGSFDFVSIYNRVKDNFKNIPVEKGSQLNYPQVLDFLRDSKNRLWISTDQTGVQLYDQSTKNFKGIDFKDYSGKIIHFDQLSEVYNLTELKNGNILAPTLTEGIFIYNPSANEFQPYFSNPKLNAKNIFDIFEDSSGKLWLGGKDEIKIYNPLTYDMKSISMVSNLPAKGTDNLYGKFYENSSDNILMACNYGILETDLNANNFSLLTKNITNINPTNFYKDNFGIYWISTNGNGLYRFDPAKKPFQYYPVGSNSNSSTSTSQIVSVVQNPVNKNELFASLDKQGIFKFDRSTNKFTKIQNQSGKNLIVDDRENLWYTIDDDALYKLNLKTGNKETFPFKNISYTRAPFQIYNIKTGPDKNIWISDRQGVNIFNPETNTFHRLPTLTNKPISVGLISEIRNVVENNKPVAAILKVGEGANLSKDFSLDKTTKVLIINLGEGRLTSLNENMFDYGWIEDSNNKKIWSTGNIQKSFNDGGGYKNRITPACAKLPAGKYSLHFVSDIGNNYGAFNVDAPPDSEWYGIQVIPINDKQYSDLDKKIKTESDNKYFPAFEVATDIEFSRKYINTAWIATIGAGLIRLNLQDNTYKQYHFDDGTERFPNANRLTGLLEDRNGKIWASTQESLLRFNPETEKFKFINQEDGLASNVVFFSAQDLNGNLWFGTPGGLSLLDKNSTDGKLSFINYDNKDGINDLPVNYSLAMTADGEIFYGGYNGLNAFYPGSANKTLPDPVITDLTISGTPVEKLADELNLKADISETKQLELPYADNNLSFEFASIHFSRPAKNKIAYMLEGLDKDWNYTNRRFASYLNLSPGDYIFKVKGSNGDGIWNPKVASIKIIINPPWYRTTIAYIFYGILFVGLLFGIDRFQRRRILNKERNATAIKEAELRAKIAEAENERKTKELEEARQLQLSMLPKEIPQFPHLNIGVYMKTATEVGGDYYDFNVAMDGTLTVVLGDATGHGMRAGTMVTSAKSLFNSYANNPDILFTFKEMTRCIKQMKFHSLAMCMTMLKIKENKLIMSAAGMPPVYIYRRNNRVIEEHLMKGMPLGAMENFPYQLKELELSPGDTLLLMSDGLPELQNDKKEVFGYRRTKNSFEEVAEKEPEEIISYLNREGNSWANDKDPDDDVTFVVIKIK